MRKDSDLAVNASITSDMLANRPLIVSRQTMNAVDLSEWLGIPKEKIRVAATSNLIFNGSLLVEEGMGYAITLDRLINCTGESNLCFRPLYPLKPAQMYLVWKKYQVFSKAAERFLNDFKMIAENDMEK